MSEVVLKIDGMHCGACVRRVEQALQQVRGVEVKEVRVGAARVQVEDAAVLGPDLLGAVAKAGYSAHLEQ